MFHRVVARSSQKCTALAADGVNWFDGTVGASVHAHVVTAPSSKAQRDVTRCLVRIISPGLVMTLAV